MFYTGRGFLDNSVDKNELYSFDQRDILNVFIWRKSDVQGTAGAIVTAIRASGGAIIGGDAHSYLQADAEEYCERRTPNYASFRCHRLWDHWLRRDQWGTELLKFEIIDGSNKWIPYPISRY